MANSSIRRNTVFSAIKTASSLLFPLITFSYSSRVLLPENVGKINFSLSIVSYFALVASLGINTYAIRACSAVRDDKAKLEKEASQIFSINCITTIVAYLALIVTILVSSKLKSATSLIMIQSLSILSTTIGTEWLNSAMEDFKYITIRTVLLQVVSLILMLVFVKVPEDYYKYALITLLSTSGANIANVFYRRRYCRISFIRNVRSGIDWKRHMWPILYLFVMLLAQTVFNSIDITMLGLIHGDREVGIYSTAHKILNIINQVVGALLPVILPRLSSYFAEQRYDQINRLLRRVLSFNLTVGLPIAVGVFAIAKDAIVLVAGPEYSEATLVLQILMVGFVISLFGGNFIGNAILLPSKREKYYMIVCCVAAGINIICNRIFIPYFGASAAAGTTAVCSLLILVLLLLKVDKNIRITEVRKLILAPLVGCAGIGLICFCCASIESMWIRMAMSVIGSAVIYSLVQIGLKNELVMDTLHSIRGKLGGKQHE